MLVLDDYSGKINNERGWLILSTRCLEIFVSLLPRGLQLTSGVFFLAVYAFSAAHPHTAEQMFLYDMYIVSLKNF